MKYRQLTKEQFEDLHKEFAQFLASQKIDDKKWKQIKNNHPNLVEEEMNLFSDMVWEDVLSKVNYLEHFSVKSINLFKTGKDDIQRIVVKISNGVNLLKKDGYEWLLKNPNDVSVEYFRGDKKYSLNRNSEIFDLIEKGSQISKGELFEFFNQLTT